jgi:hypothetical protein
MLPLPAGAEITLKPLPKQHGVARYGKEPVRELLIETPAGELRATPSQIWREATSNQARSMVRKRFPEATYLYPLEMKVRVIVTLYDSMIDPLETVWPMEAYHRWLLEVQEQMVRHMDWDRYVAADYQRMTVKLAEQLDVKDRS